VTIHLPTNLKVVRTIELPASVDSELQERAQRLGKSVEETAVIAVISALLQEELEKDNRSTNTMYTFT
jgi:hypothetical protein